MAQPVIVAKVPCARSFPAFERELLAIAGRNPVGEPRLRLEWGGTATRPVLPAREGVDGLVPDFGARPQQGAKFARVSEECVVGWTFAGDPTARSVMDRQDRYTDETDLSAIPPNISHFRDGRPRVALEHLATIDHPIPNWFVTDWMSPAQIGQGFGYGRGYHGQIWRVYDGRRDGEPFWGYRDPDAGDLTVIRQYWYEKTHERETMGVHIDEPIEGHAAALQQSWMNRAVRHLAEERRGNTIEECVPIVEKYLDENYAKGPKAFLDLGGSHVS